jgi:hypothetical protein
MKLHLHWYKTQPSCRDTRLCTSILAATFACATLFLPSQSAAQSRFTRDFDYPAQDAAAAALQVSATPATPAEMEISAPVPTVEEASLVNPATNSFFLLAQDGGQSSSSIAAPAKPPAAKSKSQHRGLGVALAALGSVALAVGVAAYAIGRDDFCANAKSGGCPEARDAGLALMPVGAGVAVTGFYLVLRH